MLLHPPQPYEPKKDDGQIFLDEVHAEFKKILEIVKANPNKEYVYARFPNVALGELSMKDYRKARQLEGSYCKDHKKLRWNRRMHDGHEHFTVLYDPTGPWQLFLNDVKAVFTK